MKSVEIYSNFDFPDLSKIQAIFSELIFGWGFSWWLVYTGMAREVRTAMRQWTEMQGCFVNFPTKQSYGPPSWLNEDGGGWYVHGNV
jgi:hypothetical protein